MMHYYLKEYDAKKDTLNLAIISSIGDTIRNFTNHPENKKDSLASETGSNLFVWNMRYSEAKRFEGLVFWWGSMAGPKTLPGTYRIDLSLNGKSQSQSFEILADPRNGLSP